jgi:uroporphyrinogen-III decarboxylase
LRAKHPTLLMLGGFDKMVMHRGEAAMRAEFERLLPVWRGGGFVLSCDHQTPPGVSLADYALYTRLLREYARAVHGNFT